MRYLFLIVITLTASSISWAQGIKVADVKETVSGSDAFHAPMDKNGHPCGLVKILSLIPDLRFEGEVEGDYTFENNEYKVFLAKGSKQLVIKRSHVMPVVVIFPDYGIDEISSKATYNIKLKEVSLNPTKNLLVIDVKPRNATVYIDDQTIDNENNDGGYRLLLPKGEHLCKIECRGYRSYASVIKIGKGTHTINADLESLLADVEIVSQTSGAHIMVDGEEVGFGSWKGKLPAGSYKVDVQLDGYIPASLSLVLEEKDSRTVSIPQLTRAKGNLEVSINVKDAKVYLDGKLVSNPQNIKDVQTGEHKLAIKAPFGYKDVEKKVTIRTGSNDPIAINMEPLNESYAKAFAGDIDAICKICSQRMESSKYNEKDSVERNFWYKTICERLKDLNKVQFEMVCPVVSDGAGSDFSEAGMYTFYRNDAEKALPILQKWIAFNPDDDSAFLEISELYIELKKFEDAIKSATRGLDICGYEGYMYGYVWAIALSCIKVGNVNRAISIFKGHIDGRFGWQKGYEVIGDVYKEMGDKKTAIIYYERFLKEKPNAKPYEREDVQAKIRECKR